MHIKFIGVGEAFDEELPNTSILVTVQGGGGEQCILLDCGFTVPPCFWKSCPDAERLDAIWISHFHGDHFFGLPALFTRFWQMKRQKPLLIVGQQGAAEIVTKAFRLAYPSMADKLGYELRFAALEPGEVVWAGGVAWRSALNDHSRKDLAVRLEGGGKSVFYSGDGLSTDQTLSLARGADLAIHEAFRIDSHSPGHSSVTHCIDFARRAKVRRLALVHVERSERSQRGGEILDLIAGVSDLEVFLPEPGDEIRI